MPSDATNNTAVAAAFQPYIYIDELRDLQKPAGLGKIDIKSPIVRNDQFKPRATLFGVDSTIYAKPDGNGGVIEVRSGSSSKENYTAHHYANGLLQVMWQDGREMLRYADADGTTHTTMSGPASFQNFSAQQAGHKCSVLYSDGSGFDIDGSDRKVYGKYGGTNSSDLQGSASNFHLSTIWNLTAASNMERSHLVSRVKSAQRQGQH
jgi:hypothetical protein